MYKNLTLGLVALSLFPLSSQAQAQLNGAGATFPELLYTKWALEYKASGGAAINYQGIGSGGGIKAITAKTVDFGATDGPMTAEERQRAPGVLHIPMCVGAVVVVYNVPGVPSELKLTGPLLAEIYLHKITTWNDPKLAKLNPGVKLPALPIVTVARADGSGTTAIFTNYLTKISPAFKTTVGEGKTVSWPKPGIAGKGTMGVAALVKQTPGAIGYVEEAFAEKNKLSFAQVQNAKGKFIKATLKSASDAAAGVTLPADFCAMATNTTSPSGYPIAGFTWILIHPDAKPEVKKFLKWCLTTGQKSAPSHDYAPLPESVRKRALAAVEKLK